MLGRRYYDADHSKNLKDHIQTVSSLNMFIQQLLQSASKKLESPLVSEPCQVMKMPRNIEVKQCTPEKQTCLTGINLFEKAKYKYIHFKLTTTV